MKAIVILLAALLLSGCAALSPHLPVVDTPAPDATLLALSAPRLQEVQPRAVVYRDRWETEVYQLWRAQGAQAEAIYMQATGYQTVLQFPRYGLAKLTRSWKLIQAEGPPRWKPQQHVNLRKRTVFYRRFHLSSGTRACVAFSSDWAMPPDDPQSRPAKAMFGYYCKPKADGTMSDDEARRIAGSVSAPKSPPAVANVDAYNTHALRLAQEGPARGGIAGYRRFPLRLARFYQVGDGSDNATMK